MAHLMNKGTALQSKVIDWLRFPLAVAVVLLHAGEITSGTYGNDLFGVLRIILSQGICRIAVPCFFFFSGFLFFTGLEEWDRFVWIGKIRKRSRTLLVPYLLWNLIALMAGFLYSWFRSRFNGEIVPLSLSETIWEVGGLNMFWASTFGCPIDYPLWFLRDLIVFVAATPFVFFLCRRCGKWGMLFLFLICWLIGSRDIEGFFFFSFGAFFKISRRDFLPLFFHYRVICYAFSFIGLLLLVYSYEGNPALYKYIKYLFVFFGVISVVNIATSLLNNGLTEVHPFLCGSSFFIYSSHAILILHDIAHYIVLHVFPFQSDIGMCVALFLQTAITVGICLAIYALMKRWTPWTLSMLTGSRG